MKNKKTQILVECAIMLGLASALSQIKFLQMPMGGSVTLMSLLPIALISIKRGVKVGIPVAFLFAIITFALSRFEVFAWGLTPIALIGSLLLDYTLSPTVLGLSGMFRHKGIKGQLTGITMAVFLIFMCHFVSGILIFGQFADGRTPFMHSLLYNGSYLLPELGMTLVGATFLLKTPQVRKMFSPAEIF